METALLAQDLIPLGISNEQAEILVNRWNAITTVCKSAEAAWEELATFLCSHQYPFVVHLLIFNALYPDWKDHPDLAPAWIPNIDDVIAANITGLMASLDIADVKTFHHWTVKQSDMFWRMMLKNLNIIFKSDPSQICDLSQGITKPNWFAGATMNIVDSCLQANADDPAIIEMDEQGKITTLTYAELNKLVNSVAYSLQQTGFKPSDPIAIIMPMNFYAVTIYLGIIKMGGIVVSIADSFSPQEIALRMKIAKAKAVFTQDVIAWEGKKIPLYQKFLDEKNNEFSEVRCIVLAEDQQLKITLRDQDISWQDFYNEQSQFTSEAVTAMTACNILFSSGTTAEPKAIIWNHSTAIKAASDAHLHHNIKPKDRLAWPTNLGWMMGPWLIYAALMNKATIALFTGSPKGRAFGEFVAKTHVSMLGVVPTLVAQWRMTKCMEKLNWQSIKVFSSTGECSNPEDMLYLMYLAEYKPIIEYCGGTEIGGAYISSTVVQNNYPSLFSTPTMGLDFTIIDEEGKPATFGEVAIIPGALGLSTELLNADHDKVYFANMPKNNDGIILRRHGDLIKQYENGYYSILGRADDAMNLGGIKISAAEIERVIAGCDKVIETAAIAVTPPTNGPSWLVIFAVTTETLDKMTLQKEMQQRINRNLNPLFKIHDLVFISQLPKTASNKIMRRLLRQQYAE